MHEVAAIQGIVKTVLDTMQQAGACQVKSVQISLGLSGHFTEEIARQNFAMLTKGTAAEGAVLEIAWLPATFQCVSCWQRFDSVNVSPAGDAPCPQCGQPALEVHHSDDCYVNSVDVAFAGDSEAVDAEPQAVER